MIIPLQNTFKAISFMLFIVSFFSCSKSQKDPDVTPDKPQPALTAKINNADYNLAATDFTSTYYTTDGDNVKALQTTASLDANGNKLVFFISDLKSGTVNLSKKAGTSLNPGNPVLKINTTATTTPVQTYVQYTNAGNIYFANSGSVTVTINASTAAVSWNIVFKDAAGKDFTSTGSYTAANFTNNAKPKTQIVDPTPVSTKPTIESISPVQGKYNDTVTITGVNYSSVLTDNVVKFNGVDAAVKTATPTQLRVLVPLTGTTGNISLKVKNSETVNGPVFTYVALPNLIDVKPMEGRTGDLVTITGINFSNNPADVVVKFGTTAATVVTATTTQVTVKVPAGLKTGGFVPLTISIKGVTSYSVSTYLVDAPYPALNWEGLASIPQLQTINQIAHVGQTLLITGGKNSPYLYYSADGKTFSNVYNNLPFNKSKKLTINVLKSSKSTYYITTNQGIAKSINGTYWVKLIPDLNSPDTALTGITVTHSYVALINGNRLYRSTNNGETWTRTAINLPSVSLNYATAISENYSSNKIFAVDTSRNYTSKEEKLFYTSTDGGLTWQATSNYTGIYYYNLGYKDFLAAASYSVFCAFSYKGAVQAEGSQVLYRSTTKGDSWSNWIQVGTEVCNVIKTDSATVTYGSKSFNLSINDGVDFKSYPMPTGYTLGGIEITPTYYYIMGFSATGDRKIFRAARQ